jgi:hypothetical protein
MPEGRIEHNLVEEFRDNLANMKNLDKQSEYELYLEFTNALNSSKTRNGEVVDMGMDMGF